jgi:hypothetical protein
MNAVSRCFQLFACAGVACSSVAVAQVTPEVEPNENKASATPVVAPMQPGHTLTGNTTGTSTTVAGPASADMFRVKTAAAPLGIYRYRLVLTTTGTAGHTGTIRGLSQVAAAQAPWLPGQVIGTPSTTDTQIQASSTLTTPTRFNQWYGFGKEEEIYYQVTGTASTTGDYVATLERTAVTPVDIATAFSPGDITILTLGQGHTTDTEIHVFDANFNAIVGYSNDDEAAAAVSGVPSATGTTLQSVLKRPYAAGTYYIMIANFNTCTNLPSPSDDDFRTGALLDFPNAVANSSTTANLNIAFTVTDGVNTVQTPATRVGAFEVNWFKMTVGTPGGGCYANCDGSTGNPLLTANDFQCFLNKYAANDTYANCDGSTGNPLLTANDFQCFLNKYAGGCT